MKWLIAIALLFFMFLSISFINKAVMRVGQSKSVSPYRVTYINKTINLTLVTLFILLVTLFLGIEYSQLAVFLSSAFAVIGVALFAQWSILSNITASMIIFFAFPYRVGDRVKVVDSDEDITGVIEEISLFHVIIKREADTVTFPNSLILQKAVIKLGHTSTAPTLPDIEPD